MLRNIILSFALSFATAGLSFADSDMRRVITSEDENGVAHIYIDDKTPHVMRQGPFAMVEMWANDELVIKPTLSDHAVGKIGSSPDAGHTLMRYVVIPPDKQMAELMKHSARHSKAEIKTESDSPGMHQTNTIDYGFVLKGEIVLDLGKEQVLLKEGDSFVQNGTRHAWRNQTSSPAIIGVVMVGANRSEMLNK